MEKNFYNPYVTEHIHSLEGRVSAVCYFSPDQHTYQEITGIHNENHIITLHDKNNSAAVLMVIPLKEKSLRALLRNPEQFSHLDKSRTRIGISFASFKAHHPALLELTKNFSFWLYDFASPGNEWSLLESFPFSAVVLTENFFKDNYEKFSFPFFLSALREQNKEIYLRTATPFHEKARYEALNISGWQEQSIEGNIFDSNSFDFNE